MTETLDWLFPLPVTGDRLEQLAVLERQMAADPLAAAVDDQEAESIMTVAYGLRHSPLSLLRVVSRHLRLGLEVQGERHRRLVVRAALRRWPRPVERDYLKRFPTCLKFGELLGEDQQVSVQKLSDAWYQGIPLGALLHHVRLSGWADQIPSLIEQLGEVAQLDYQIALLAGKLMVREYTQEPKGTPAQAAPDRRLTRQLRQQERQASHLQQDYRQMADRRTAAHRQGRKTAGEIEEMLSRARAEVESAEANLERRLGAQRKELEEQGRKEQLQLEQLRQEIRRTRQAFTAVLAQRTAQVGLAPLKGWTLSLAVAQEDWEEYRPLVESAGAVLVERGGALRIELGAAEQSEPEAGLFRTPETGLAAFERLLGRQVIPALPRLQARRASAAGRG